MARIEEKFIKEENKLITTLGVMVYDPDQVYAYIDEHYNDYFKTLPDGEYKKSILTKIYKNYMSRNVEDGHRRVSITTSHINFLQQLPNDLIKRLFYSLIVRACVKPHSSGWVSLDFENTIKYGLPYKEAKKAKIEIYSQCTPYGFNCRVSGSTKPILCFSLPEFKPGEIVFEFEDGSAEKMYKEVISYVNNNSNQQEN